LWVDIGFDPAFKYDATSVPVPGLRKLSALVDTGATESCIDSTIAAKLNLPIVDKRKIGGVGGTQEVDMYLAQVHIPALGFTIYGAFAGVHLQAGGQTHSSLIGRTFLQNFTLTYEGRTGTVVISSD
jgi:predicted aspartyl protease